MHTTTDIQLTPAAPTSKHSFPALCVWLSICLAMVVAMVILGGYTRLSGSGLSITDWRPITGILPPLNYAQWQHVFEAYQATPQYAQINHGMTLSEFKTIFWPEYLHRLLGRLVGILFFVPMLWFWWRGQLSLSLKKTLLILLCLGGIQGIIGWYMVQSGLIDRPYVSHLRLTFHLGMAFVIAGMLLWTLLSTLALPTVSSLPSTRARWGITLIAAGIFLQILLGAMLAGLHGGLIYNTFPTMNGSWIPSDILYLEPWWHNIFYHIPTIQFLHRWLAIGLFIIAMGYLFIYQKSLELYTRRLFFAFGCLLVLQCILGVLTLINSVPTALAIKHQLTGLALFLNAIAITHRMWQSK